MYSKVVALLLLLAFINANTQNVPVPAPQPTPQPAFGPAPPANATIAQLLGTSAFNNATDTILNLVNTLGLSALFNSPGLNITALVPTDNAITNNLTPGVPATNAALTTEIVRHILSINNPIYTSQMQNDQVIIPLGGGWIRVNRYNNTPSPTGIYFNGRATIIQADVNATNGVADLIDNIILVPNATEDDTILSWLQNDGRFTNLTTALTTAGLTNVLNNYLLGPTNAYTLFAPTDAAFAGVNLTQIPLANLITLLTAHVLPSTFYNRGLVSGSYRTLNPLVNLTVVQGNNTNPSNGNQKRDAYSDLKVSAPKRAIEQQNNQGQTTVNGFPIVAADVNVRNGVVHVVDNILVPLAGQAPQSSGGSTGGSTGGSSGQSTPNPNPSPNPAPQPTSPQPGPSPNPAPQPTSPQPGPSPNPAPQPTPQPSPQPSPSPAPGSNSNVSCLSITSCLGCMAYPQQCVYCSVAPSAQYPEWRGRCVPLDGNSGNNNNGNSGSGSYYNNGNSNSGSNSGYNSGNTNNEQPPQADLNACSAGGGNWVYQPSQCPNKNTPTPYQPTQCTTYTTCSSCTQNSNCFYCSWGSSSGSCYSSTNTYQTLCSRTGYMYTSPNSCPSNGYYNGESSSNNNNNSGNYNGESSSNNNNNNNNSGNYNGESSSNNNNNSGNYSGSSSSNNNGNSNSNSGSNSYSGSSGSNSNSGSNQYTGYNN